jgi:hypothetical protein
MCVYACYREYVECILEKRTPNKRSKLDENIKTRNTMPHLKLLAWLACRGGTMRDVHYEAGLDGSGITQSGATRWLM